MQKMMLLILLLGSFIKAQAQDEQAWENGKRYAVTAANERLVFFVTDRIVPFPKNASTYYWYARNQLHTTVAGFSGKLLDGGYQAFYSNGALKEQGSFTMGLKTGKWRSWNADGSLASVTSYRDGFKEGWYTAYGPGHKVITRGEYLKDVQQGQWTGYAGDSIQLTRYKGGKAVVPEQRSPRRIGKWFKKKKA